MVAAWVKSGKNFPKSIVDMVTIRGAEVYGPRTAITNDTTAIKKHREPQPRCFVINNPIPASVKIVKIIIAVTLPPHSSFAMRLSPSAPHLLACR